PVPAAGQAPGQLASEQAREKQIADLSRQAARGDRNARQQMVELRKQQVEQQRAERANAQQAQGQRVNQQIQTQNATRKQQQPQPQPAHVLVEPPQVEVQRKQKASP